MFCICSAVELSNEYETYLLPEIKLSGKIVELASGENTGGDNLTCMHVRNWMYFISYRKQSNAQGEAGYYHSIANIMTNGAVKTEHKGAL
ncbi:MAG: hypothetical protein ABIN01_20200 [Ferruginibacter sp.]